MVTASSWRLGSLFPLLLTATIQLHRDEGDFELSQLELVRLQVDWREGVANEWRKQHHDESPTRGDYSGSISLLLRSHLDRELCISLDHRMEYELCVVGFLQRRRRARQNEIDVVERCFF